ncbi:MAG: hypothetical protein HY760_00650, partial [Nitrospirae bacterium]|nr:hypothetical protein [Nitrospirota bacterium]
MRLKNMLFYSYLALFILFLSTPGGVVLADETPDPPLQGRYIVVCNPALIDVTGCAARAHATGAEVLKSLPLIHGVAIALPPHVPAEAVIQFSGILRI